MADVDDVAEINVGAVVRVTVLLLLVFGYAMPADSMFVVSQLAVLPLCVITIIFQLDGNYDAWGSVG